jgi:hypothetical protein
LHRGVDHVLVDEVDVWWSARRMDLTLVTAAALTAVEIKSDRDSLRRLPGQADAYGRIADRAVLVTGDRYLERATACVPDWWAIWRVHAGAVDVVRAGSTNPGREPLWMAAQLRRGELVEELRWAGRTGLSRLGVDELRADLADLYALDELGAILRTRLMRRADWLARAARTRQVVRGPDVRKAAARLRLVTDKRQQESSPEWVHELAGDDVDHG